VKIAKKRQNAENVKNLKKSGLVPKITSARNLLSQVIAALKYTENG
jgi:hypothetical protein